MTWEALGDQGLQWDAAAVRKPLALAKAEQMAVSRSAEGYALVAGTVLYDGGELFGLTKQMQAMSHGAVVRVNPADAEKAGISDGAAVTVRNSHGALALAVKFDSAIRPGSVWIPESLPGAPVGALLNGSDVEEVVIEF
jgi:predicted molibdopterin-dependent oxidoreductase YjgC